MRKKGSGIMGWFGRKQSNDAEVSTLSETEIQQKLYGEFKKDASRVVGTGEREGSTDLSSASPKKIGAMSDLFDSSKEPAQRSYSAFSPVSRESSKVPETVLKPDVSGSEERRYQGPSSAQPEDPYARYREHFKSSVKSLAPFSGGRSLKNRISALFHGIFGPGKWITRQVLYWTGGVLAVFLLFWGVNALNTQREQFMQTRYQASPETQGSAVVLATKEGREPLVAAASRSSESVPEGVSVPVSPSRTAAKEVAEPSRRPVSATAKYGGRFVIQVATYPSQDYAGRVMAALKGAGFSNAFITENTRPTGTVFYMVMIGGFRTAAEAQQQLAKFRANEVSRPFSDAFVKTIA